MAIVLAICCVACAGNAQDLRQRAYIITPLHPNAVTVSYAFNDGSVYIENVLPIKNNSGRSSVPALNYYHSLTFFRRSANITASLPYVVGNVQGTVNETQKSVYRSGFADSVFRLAVNLKGGPAMTPQEFAKWKQKTLLGPASRPWLRPASIMRAI